MEKEIRKIENLNSDDLNIVTGKAICFESESNDLGFIEIIHRGAIT